MESKAREIKITISMVFTQSAERDNAPASNTISFAWLAAAGAADQVRPIFWARATRLFAPSSGSPSSPPPQYRATVVFIGAHTVYWPGFIVHLSVGRLFTLPISEFSSGNLGLFPSTSREEGTISCRYFKYTNSPTNSTRLHVTV